MPPELSVVAGCVTIDLADLVLRELEGLSWSRAFHARRAWVPVYFLEDLVGQLELAVVPATITFTAAHRRAYWRAVAVELGVLEKPFPDDHPLDDKLNAAADRHAAFVEELAEHFLSEPGRSFVTTDGVISVTNVEILQLVRREHFLEKQQLTSTLRLTLQTGR